MDWLFLTGAVLMRAIISEYETARWICCCTAKRTPASRRLYLYRILAEHAFVHDHKFPSLQAIVDYRKGLSQRMKTLAAQRAEIVKQMRRKDAPPELADQHMALTCKIAELRKEDKIAEGAIKRIQRTRESNRIDRENRMPLHPRPRRRRREQERECTDTTASVLPWA